MRVQIYTHLDPGILLTYMITFSDNRTYMHEYDPDNPDGYVYEVTGRLRFTVTVDEDSGYKFKRWVVRTGSTIADSTVRYVTTDPFEYSGTDNLWIRAESELDTSLLYKLETTALGTVTESASASFLVSERTLYRMSLRFEKDGTATFYSTGDCDTIGYLTTSSEWNNTTGMPSSTLYAHDDDSGADFNYKFTYDVAQDVTYHYWFKTVDPSETGYVTAHVIPPGLKGGNVYIYTADGWKQTAVYIYDGSSWKPVKVSMFDGTTWK